MNLSKLRETVEEKGAWHVAVHSVAESDMTWRWNNNRNFLSNSLLCFSIM